MTEFNLIVILQVITLAFVTLNWFKQLDKFDK